MQGSLAFTGNLIYGAACVNGGKAYCGGFLIRASGKRMIENRTGDLRLSDPVKAAGAAAYL